MSWQSAAGVGWQPIPQQYLFTQSQIDRLRDTYVRFLKAASLASALSLDANEIAYLAYDPARAVATSAKDKTVAGPATLHPASMANIAVGSRLADRRRRGAGGRRSHRRHRDQFQRGDDPGA